MTDISKKIEDLLREEFGSRFGIESTKFATAHILKLIEEERAGWVERVAKEVEEMKRNPKLPYSGTNGDYWRCVGWDGACELAAAIIRNSKEV